MQRGILGTVDTLLWDAGNLHHLHDRNEARHTAQERPITREEVDGLYDLADYTTRDVEYLTWRGEWEVQVHLIGRTPEGRFLTVACQVSNDGHYRPVTIWPSSDSEILLYWKDVADNERP